MAFVGAIAPALGILGSATSAVGTIMGGVSTAAAADYNAQVAQNNAQIAQQNAAYSMAAGQAKTETQGLQEAETLGAIKTSQAASGIDVNTGSALDVQKGQREKGLLDQQTVLNNAELQAYGYQTQAAGFQSQAALDQAEAAQAPIGAAIGAAGGLLSGASSVGLKWNQFTGGGTTSDTGSSSLNPFATSQGPTGFAVGGA